MKMQWTRRALLRDGTLAAMALVAGCKTQPVDDDNSGSDTSSEVEVKLSKQVFVQVLGADSVRLRFETREDIALRLVVTDPEGIETEATLERTSSDLVYEWNFIADNDSVDGEGDVAGIHVLHNVVLSQLRRGETYSWRLERGNGASDSGTFRVSPSANDGFRLGWISDTMAIVHTEPINVLASKAPDLVVHGGDLVYQSHFYDTWVELSRDLVPLTSTAPFMPLVGNHEFESETEVEEMYDRLFGAPGDSHGARYFAFTYGCMRFIAYDSESGREGLDEAVSGQDAWLEAELAAASSDPNIKLIVVGMHRPMYTLSQYWVSDSTARDARHALFTKYGVNLVFAGHMHGYERFHVDGVVYIVDGGGGALLYDPVEGAADVEAARPGESDLQQSWSRTYGCTTLEVDDLGGWTLRRFDSESGDEVDQITG